MKENEKEKNVQVNRFNAAGLTCNPHSKYWHISFSIQLISLNWNKPCEMINHDLFEYV